jgi:hypothetical protein
VNGVWLLEQSDGFYKAMIALSSRELNKTGLAELFRQAAKP